MGTPVLSVRDVNTFYGGIHALRGISLTVEQSEIVALIGGNGAGKSTTLNTISGLVRPRSGQVLLNGEDLGRFPAHEIMARGIVQVPEGRRIFARLTVLENLRMGAYTRNDREELEADFERVFTLFPRLRERSSQAGGTLSGGEQQMLAIGRALMSHPKLLLLDEPSMGLAPILVELIFDVIREIHAQGTTVLLVEQNALMALGVAHRGYILQTGSIVLEDTAANLRQNPDVQKAYLGG
jgi:branched-chain amino acid transport system ATP-binding protein